MADGMAKVQAGALALLVLIVFHHVLLHAQGTVDDALNVFFGVFTLKQGKQLRVSNQTRLDGLRQAVDKVAAGQRCQASKSTSTTLGCQKAPTMFLVSPGQWRFCRQWRNRSGKGWWWGS